MSVIFQLIFFNQYEQASLFPLIHNAFKRFLYMFMEYDAWKPTIKNV